MTTRAILILCSMIVLAMWTVTIGSIRTERQSLIDRSRSEARNLASAFAADVSDALDRVAASIDRPSKCATPRSPTSTPWLRRSRCCAEE
jgi:hypothetical protein